MVTITDIRVALWYILDTSTKYKANICTNQGIYCIFNNLYIFSSRLGVQVIHQNLPGKQPLSFISKDAEPQKCSPQLA